MIKTVFVSHVGRHLAILVAILDFYILHILGQRTAKTLNATKKSKSAD